MSNRTLVEINHDRVPGWSDEALLAWARAIYYYVGNGDKKYLPSGVTFKHLRHHSDPDPMRGHGDPS